MSEHQPDYEKSDPQEGMSPGNDTPTTPTDEKTEPEAGTASADKRSQESQVESEDERSSTLDEPGATGGNQTR